MPSLGTAQTFPSRAITIVVPVPPGSTADMAARIIADALRLKLGQSVILENVPGAGGSVGVAKVTRAPADGYTLSFGNWLTHVGASVAYPVQYDVLTDLRPIS